jgi:hypothetical protein
VVGCAAYSRGGGIYAYSSVVDRCTVRGNWAVDDGGLTCARGSVANRCIIRSNTASYAAGVGCWSDCTVLNSLIAGNMATQGMYGGGEVGGISGGSAWNCTIVGNSAEGEAGGASYCTLWNSIVCGNTAPVDTNSRNCTFIYSCTTPLPAGEGNITNAPLFIAVAHGDYHLALGSPCIDVGTNLPWMATAVDLDGLPRIHDGVVDMGCYEWIPEPCGGVAAVVFALLSARRRKLRG